MRRRLAALALAATACGPTPVQQIAASRKIQDATPIPTPGPRAADIPPSKGPAHAPQAGRTPSGTHRIRINSIQPHGEIETAILHTFGPVAGPKAIRIVRCETGGTLNPQIVSPDGRYHGLFQFDRRTWASVGGMGVASTASAGEQIERAHTLFLRRGWQPWSCA